MNTDPKDLRGAAAKMIAASGEASSAAHAVLNEFDRVLARAWKEGQPDPHAYAYGWVRTAWETALAAAAPTPAQPTPETQPPIRTGGSLNIPDVMRRAPERAAAHPLVAPEPVANTCNLTECRGKPMCVRCLKWGAPQPKDPT